MSFVPTVFTPLLNFLASQTAGESMQTWPKGPRVAYRNSPSVPVAQYAAWIRTIESSPALQSESPGRIIQRLRRLYYSPFTAVPKPKVGGFADELISDKTIYANPPLTTDHIDQATLDGLYGTSTITTARGTLVDVGHIWMALDVKFAGITAYGHFADIIYIDSEIIALLTWTGDLGGVANDWSLKAKGLDDANRARIMLEEVNQKVSRADLLGDMDGIILSSYWNKLDPLIISKDLLAYYADDAMPQAQATNLSYPNSARRFHHFLASAKPSLSGDGKSSTPLVVTIDVDDVVDDLKPALLDAADDFLAGGTILGGTLSAPGNIDAAGKPHFEKLCRNFAKFLESGLTNGMADWPPNPW